MQVACHAADAKADAGMLDGVIGVEQLCTHTAHPLLLGVHDHLFQPVGGDDLGIVVEQQQIFAGGILLAKVVQGTVIEALALPGHDLEVVRVFLLHPELKKELWGGHLWNPSYCAVTVSDRSREQVLAYIEGKKEKSR